MAVSSRSPVRLAVGTYLQKTLLDPLRPYLPTLPPDLIYRLPTTPITGNLAQDLAVAKAAVREQGAVAIQRPVRTHATLLQSLAQGFLKIIPVATGPLGIVGVGASGLSSDQGDLSKSVNIGGKTMGLFDDIWGGIQSTASSIFPTNQGIDWNNVLNQGIGLATTALAPRGISQGFTPPTAQPAMMAAAPAIARASAVVGRGFFNRFPNLATAIQGLRNSGMNVTRSKLYGVMKRFGPEFLVTGGLLTAAAVNELAVAGPGYRRMNPANVRALRRSVRRIESFHRLCTTTDRLRRPRARKKC